MSQRLTFRKKVLFSLVTIGLSIVLIEVLLQTFYFVSVGDFLFRRALPPIYAADPIRCYKVASNLTYTHRTNEFETEIFSNSLGLRTASDHREYTPTKPDDVYRILVTGPSFAFGWGSNYDAIFPTLIENELKIPGKRVEVINLGTPSQPSSHQLCWLEKVGYAYQPDMILHVSYGREVNPVATSCPATLECPGVVDGQLVPRGLGPLRRAKAFAKQFALVFYGYYAYNVIAKPPPGVDESRSFYGQEENAAGGDEEFDRTAETYLAHREFLKALLGPRTEVAFLYLPYSYSVHPEDVDRFPDIHASDVPLSRGRIRLGIEAIERLHVPILDTLPYLSGRSEEGRLYFWLDIHLTPLGNRVVADAAIPFLRDIIVTSAGLPESSD
ncbi:MAG: hypothetical protein KC438_07505 [Thermomicrobiales bacterium]|nr:hypothetical protein [Thermomicrobiales bacterium]